MIENGSTQNEGYNQAAQMVVYSRIRMNQKLDYPTIYYYSIENDELVLFAKSKDYTFKSVPTKKYKIKHRTERYVHADVTKTCHHLDVVEGEKLERLMQFCV